MPAELRGENLEGIYGRRFQVRTGRQPRAERVRCLPRRWSGQAFRAAAADADGRVDGTRTAGPPSTVVSPHDLIVPDRQGRTAGTTVCSRPKTPGSER